MEAIKHNFENLDNFGIRRVSQLFSSFKPKKKNQASENKLNETESNISASSISNSDSIHSELNRNESEICEENASFHNEREIHTNKYKNEIREDVIHLIKFYGKNVNDVVDGDKNDFRYESALAYVKEAFGDTNDEIFQIFESEKDIQSPKSNENNNKVSKSQTRVKEKKVKRNSYLVSSKLNHFENIEAHSALTQMFLKHELKGEPDSNWSGNFNPIAGRILEYHAKYRSLDEPYISHAKWTAYIEIHKNHPLSFEVFHQLLEILIIDTKENSKPKKFRIKIPKKLKGRNSLKEIQYISFIALGLNQCTNKKENNEEAKIGDDQSSNDDKVLKLFWESTYKLFDSFLEYVISLHSCLIHSDTKDDNARNLLKIFEIFKRFEKVCMPDNGRNFVEDVKLSLSDGAKEHFRNIIDEYIIHQSKDNVEIIQELINVIKATKDHLKKFTNYFGLTFESFLGINSANILYDVYDSKLTEIIKPAISKIATKTKENAESLSKPDEETVKKIFELYNELKRFADYGKKIYSDDDFKTKHFIEWFSAGFKAWQEVLMLDAITRVKTSVEMDKLQPDHTKEKFSSSAIDTMQILYGIKNTWEYLGWIEGQEGKDFIKQICQDLCNIIKEYFLKFIDKFQNSLDENKIQVTMDEPLQLGIVVANYIYIYENLEICIEGFIKNKEADENAIRESIKSLKEHMMKLLSSPFKKMHTEINNLLTSSIHNGNQNHENIFADKIDEMMIKLHKNLTTEEFEIAKSFLWQDILSIVSDHIESSVNFKKSQEYFCKIQEIFDILKQIFTYTQEESNNDDATKKIEYLLHCYSSDISHLILQYYKERYEMQQQIKSSPNGILTILCCFIDNTIKLEILNAKNLIPSGSNNKCDSFVKVHIIPKEDFPTCQNIKTKVQQNTYFPLYDEVFELPLTQEQQNMKDAFIYFKIKDKNLIANNSYLAETFLLFRDIPECTSTDQMKQIHLTLTKFQENEMKSLEALKLRSDIGDKKAKKIMNFVAQFQSSTNVVASDPLKRVLIA